MAGSSISELILFIAALSIAAAVAGVLVTTVGGVSTAVDDQGTNVAAQINTDIDIISVPDSGAVYDSGSESITLLIKNTGEKDYSDNVHSHIDILVDGQYIPPSDYSVTLPYHSEFHEGAVARVSVDRSLTTGEHTASVHLRGNTDTITFPV